MGAIGTCAECKWQFVSSGLVGSGACLLANSCEAVSPSCKQSASGLNFHLHLAKLEDLWRMVELILLF